MYVSINLYWKKKKKLCLVIFYSYGNFEHFSVNSDDNLYDFAICLHFKERESISHGHSFVAGLKGVGEKGKS